MLYRWEGNRRFGIALDMCSRLEWLSVYRMKMRTLPSLLIADGTIPLVLLTCYARQQLVAGSFRLLRIFHGNVATVYR